MNDIKIRYKLYLLYFLCMLIPLFVTDTLIVINTYKHEKRLQQYQLEKIADSVETFITNTVDVAAGLGINIYQNSYINDFIVKKFNSPLDYVVSYQSFQQYNMITSGFKINGYNFSLYVDNDSIINGGTFQKIVKAKQSSWYREYEASQSTNFLYFDYDDFSTASKRKIIFIRPMDYLKKYNI